MPELELGAEETEKRLEARRWMRRRVVYVGVILTGAAVLQWHRPMGLWIVSAWGTLGVDAPGVGRVGAVEMIDSRGGILVDVREREEFEASHIDDARHRPTLEILKRGWPEDWPRDRPIICYCTIGDRSSRAAAALRDAGLDAYFLRGGIIGVAQDQADADGNSSAMLGLYDGHGSTVLIHTRTGEFAWMLPRGYVSRCFGSESGR